jgi:circadian clock protein KaiC
MKVSSPKRVATGIAGLDAILEGGLLQGGVYILRGPPGAGKTILANQLCFHTASGGGQIVYVTLLAEAHDRMMAHLARLRFFRPELIGDRVHYLAAFRVLDEEGLDGLMKVLRETLAARPSDLLVLDGLMNAEEAAPTERQFKRFIHDVQTLSSLTGTTTLLLSSGQRPLGMQPEHTVVDGIIEITDELTDMRSLRHVQVRKMRGADQIRGKHSLAISDEGITVRPRIETRPRLDPGEPRLPDPAQRKRFAVAALDRMLEGGLPEHSITMLLGPTGCGKTILGLQYLAAGALDGDPGLYFGFYESPRELLAKSARIGLGLEEPVERGLLHLSWQRPVEGVLDILAERLLTQVHEHGIKRLCIDGLHSFGRTIDFPERLNDAIAALGEELQKAGVTTVYTIEAPELFGSGLQLPLKDISASSQNIILLRHVELSAQLFRLISILKMRDSDYDSRIYEFRIEEGGLSVADTFRSAAQILTGTAVSEAPPQERVAARRKKGRKQPRR